MLACWEKTMQLQDLIAKSGSVVTGACADVDGKTDKKELGKYLVDGFINLRWGNLSIERHVTDHD